MTNQAKIDDLYARTEAWSDKVKADPNYDMANAASHDPEFVALMTELMEQDLDTLMVLVGKSVQDHGLPDWLLDDLESDEGVKD